MNSKLDLAGEASTGFFEWALIILIVLFAGVYLWRKYFIKKGCAGCAGSGDDESCPLHLNPQDGGGTTCSSTTVAKQQGEQPLHYQEVLSSENIQEHKREKPNKTI